MLLSVSAVSKDDIWAVGYSNSGHEGDPAQTLAMHWDGTQWKTVATPNPHEGVSNYLDSVVALASNNAWAVGDAGTSRDPRSILLHWDGNTWAPSPLPLLSNDGNALYSITATGPNDLWIAGVAGNTRGSSALVVHGDGTSWAVQNVPGPLMSDILYSIQARSSSDVWAVGAEQVPGSVAQLVLHWDGATWRPVSLGDAPYMRLRQLWDVALEPGTNDAWFVGDDGEQLGILHYRGGGVTDRKEENLQVLSRNYLYGALALSRGDAWVVGYGSSTSSGGRGSDPDAEPSTQVRPIIGHTTDGGNWSLVPGAAIEGSASLYDIARIPGTNGDLIAVGSAYDGALVETYTDLCTAATPVAPPSPTASATHPAAAPTFAPTPIPGENSGGHLFPETGKSVKGIFLDYWNHNGGLPQQGYPISDMFTEVSSLNSKPYTVQYFERAVLEYHPENQAPYNILLSQLGTFQYKLKYGATGAGGAGGGGGAPGQQPNTGAGSQLFPETGHRVGGRFLEYWKSHGGLAQQGYPISDEFQEKSDLNGKTYLVQYFERAVFEYHPENAAPYDVLLSQLGTFQFKGKYVGK